MLPEDTLSCLAFLNFRRSRTMYCHLQVYSELTYNNTDKALDGNSLWWSKVKI